MHVDFPPKLTGLGIEARVLGLRRGRLLLQCRQSLQSLGDGVHALAGLPGVATAGLQKLLRP